MRVDSEDAFNGCKYAKHPRMFVALMVWYGRRNVIMMTQVAAGTYQCKKAPFEFCEYWLKHIGCRKNIQVCIAENLAPVFILDHRLLISLIRNLVNNAEVPFFIFSIASAAGSFSAIFFKAPSQI